MLEVDATGDVQFVMHPGRLILVKQNKFGWLYLSKHFAWSLQRKGIQTVVEDVTPVCSARQIKRFPQV